MAIRWMLAVLLGCGLLAAPVAEAARPVCPKMQQKVILAEDLSWGFEHLEFLTEPSLDREGMSTLLKALSAEGIEVIIGLVPARPLVQQGALPEADRPAGWTPEAAAEGHRAFVSWLGEQGATVVDLEPTLSQTEGAFHPAHFMWTIEGAEAAAAALAEAVRAHPAAADLPEVTYELADSKPTVHKAHVALKVERTCKEELDVPVAEFTYQEHRVGGSGAMAGSHKGAPVVLAGTGFAMPKWNLAGFLSAKARLDLRLVVKPGAQALGGLATWLSSPEFHEQPKPKVLVWLLAMHELAPIPGANRPIPEIEERADLRRLAGLAAGFCTEEQAVVAETLELSPASRSGRVELPAPAAPDQHAVLLRMSPPQKEDFELVLEQGRSEVVPVNAWTKLRAAPFVGLSPDPGAGPLGAVEVRLPLRGSGTFDLRVCPTGE